MDNVDKVINMCFISLWSKGSRENNQIKFINFDSKNKKHLCVIKIAEMVQSMYGYNITIKINKIKGWFLKRKLKMNFIISPTLSEGCDIDELVGALDNIIDCEESILEKAYDEYYDMRKKR